MSPNGYVHDEELKQSGEYASIVAGMIRIAEFDGLKNSSSRKKLPLEIYSVKLEPVEFQ